MRHTHVHSPYSLLISSGFSFDASGHLVLQLVQVVHGTRLDLAQSRGERWCSQHEAIKQSSTFKHRIPVKVSRTAALQACHGKLYQRSVWMACLMFFRGTNEEQSLKSTLSAPCLSWKVKAATSLATSALWMSATNTLWARRPCLLKRPFQEVANVNGCRRDH